MRGMAALIALWASAACATNAGIYGAAEGVAFVPCGDAASFAGSRAGLLKLHAAARRGRDPVRVNALRGMPGAERALGAMPRRAVKAGWTDEIPDIAERQRASRMEGRRWMTFSLAVTACTCVFKPKTADAMTLRTLKRALVNIVRVREGAILLQTRLEDNLLAGFQDR